MLCNSLLFPTPRRHGLCLFDAPLISSHLSSCQTINLRKGNLSAGYSLLLKSGPHWLELCPSALPLTVLTSSGSTTDGSSEGGAGSIQAPPLQVVDSAVGVFYSVVAVGRDDIAAHVLLLTGTQACQQAST